MTQKMIITDETVLIDYKLVFKAIREENGNWEKVEQELSSYHQDVSQED
jgi:hypothetical protein